MFDDLRLVLAGLEIFGRPGLGPFALVENGLDGWFDSAPMGGEKVDRPQAHGSYRLPRFRGSRTVTATGIILANNVREQELLGNRLSGLLAEGQYARLQVERGGLTQWAEVSLDVCNVDPRRGSTKSDFMLQLWAPDPNKYGALNSFAVASGDPAQVLHRGNTAAAPVIVVPGPVTNGYTVTGPSGELFTVTGSVPSGTTHTIDMTEGLLKVNGSISAGVGKVARADVFTIPPGGKVNVALAAVSGSASGYVHVLDTYN